MKRVLTLATTGLFVTGLALLPLAANADQAVSGKDGKTAPAAASTTAPAGTMPAGSTAAAPVKKMDDHKVAAPATSGSSTVAPAGGTTVKPPVKTGS